LNFPASSSIDKRGFLVPFITVEMIEGRTVEQKELLMRLITEAAVTALGSAPETVRVLLHENSAANWAVGGVPKSSR
jgi:4-oxalocrotonate tautomerase